MLKVNYDDDDDDDDDGSNNLPLVEVVILQLLRNNSQISNLSTTFITLSLLLQMSLMTLEISARAS